MELHRIALVVALATLSACNKPSSPEPGKTETAGPKAGEAPAPSVSTGSYDLELRPVGTLAAGKEGAFEIVLTAKGEYHVNGEYPVKLQLFDVPGAKLPKTKLEKAKDPAPFTTTPCPKGEHACTLKVTVPVTPEAAGSIKVGGEISFSVCTEQTCLTEKKKLERVVPVG
jgi:hypothetical protein